MHRSSTFIGALLCYAGIYLCASYEVTEDLITFYYPKTKDHVQLITDDDNINELFNSTKPFQVLIHGFGGSIEIDWYRNVTSAYLHVGTHNIILVDWSDPAIQQEAKELLPQVGFFVAKFIRRLQSQLSINLTSVHIAGHSLGSHVAGFAGKSIQNFTGQKLGRITGLDAASGWGVFVNASNEDKLYKEDALLVVGIHTAGDDIGLFDPVGAIDFYPNGGVSVQPGCEGKEDESCSHFRACYLFAEEVLNPKGFVASQCGSYADFGAGVCRNGTRVAMGGELAEGDEGVYYLETNAYYPFSKD